MAWKPKNQHNVGGSHIVRLVSEAEWWVFIGIIIVAASFQKGGSLLWEKIKGDGLTPPPDIGNLTGMALTLFSQIWKFFLEGLKNPNCDEDDPWHPIQHFVDEFNANRPRTIAASIYKTMDESMSTYRPQKTKTGNLPHLSYIFRKPEPLGTEFKSVACAKTKIMLRLEIQKGKAESKYQREFGATAACVLRMALATKGCGQEDGERKRDIFIADSWFASVNSTEQLQKRGMDFINNCKTAHKFSPTKVGCDVGLSSMLCSSNPLYFYLLCLFALLN